MAKLKFPKFPKLNEPLIAKVLQHIKEENFKRYEQDIIGIVLKDPDRQAEYIENRLEMGNDSLSSGDQFAECGAKACFGGWAVLLTTPRTKWNTLIFPDGRMKDDTLEIAKERLGLTGEEGDYLFNVSETGDSRDDYKVIQKRLTDIRKSRKQLLQLETLFNKVASSVEHVKSSKDATKMDHQKLKNIFKNFQSETQVFYYEVANMVEDLDDAVELRLARFSSR